MKNQKIIEAIAKIEDKYGYHYIGKAKHFIEEDPETYELINKWVTCYHFIDSDDRYHWVSYENLKNISNNIKIEIF